MAEDTICWNELELWSVAVSFLQHNESLVKVFTFLDTLQNSSILKMMRFLACLFVCSSHFKEKRKGRTKHFRKKKHFFLSLKRALTSLLKGLRAQRELTLIYHQSAFKDSQVQWISSLCRRWTLKTLNKTRQPGLSFPENPPFPPSIPPSHHNPGEGWDERLHLH